MKYYLGVPPAISAGGRAIRSYPAPHRVFAHGPLQDAQGTGVSAAIPNAGFNTSRQIVPLYHDTTKRTNTTPPLSFKGIPKMH